MTDPKNLPGKPELVSAPEVLQQIIDQDQGEYKYSVEDFFRTPEQTAFSISPDGLHLAFFSPYKRRKNIFIREISSGETMRITEETERDIGGFFWANSKRILYVKDDGGDENFRLYGINHDGSEHQDLTPYQDVTVQLIDDLEDDEDEVIIGMNKDNPELFDPYRLNVHSGELTQLAKNNPAAPVTHWMTDHDGRLRIAMRTEGGTNTVVMYRDQEEDDFRDVITTDFTEEINPVFFDFETPHVVYALSNLDRDKKVLIRFDMHTGKETGDVIFERNDVDLSGVSYSRKRKVLAAASFVTDRIHRHFFDQHLANIYDYLKKQLPGKEIALTSVDLDEENYILRTYSDRSLGTYYHFKVTGQALTKITDISPWIDEDDMRPMEAVSYTSRDGLTIHGYLTLPDSNTDGPYPIIVNPHGGPWVRDTWGYNPEVQLLASRGYGVFQMNYRGSTGYGKDFWRSSFKQWGRKMQDDITDGVHWLINEKIADPKRVAIYGGSYGGYATLAGVTFTPDLYCCAIDYVGVSNLFTFMTTIPPYWKPLLDMMYAMVGNPELDEEEMRAASPIFHVDKIKTPLLVIQGANDPRVNIDEADQIVEQLRNKGVNVPYMVKYDEGHGFRNEENRFEVYRVILGFLARYLNN
ncbi:S9 family peptidase [Membranicola marinus]|uniref:S9 family peptidase n=1 Tax=Membranihabitans marinus TaxID=1227546 RepID=A0A953LBF7_9BACT|nr:S9 family peptidase [Membranihabitans marinus]MBY5959713.1 S9 family peptidase [Membranihabitans marinus]